MSDDTISRQAALDIFDDYNVAVENGQIEAYSRDRKRLCDLPPALPKKRTAERTETHGVCLDAISRQAAIKTLEKGLPSEPLKSKYTEGINVGFGLAITWIEQLPAVQPQPEIIRCKDCLMHGVCRFEQGLGLDGYCSQAERRTDE